MVQALISNGDRIFKDDNSPIHIDHVVKNWYEEHKNELEHMEWLPQYSDHNII